MKETRKLTKEEFLQKVKDHQKEKKRIEEYLQGRRKSRMLSIESNRRRAK